MKAIQEKNYRDEFELSTGKRFYAFAHRLSVDAQGTNLRYGYDGRVEDETPRFELTPDERREIAEEMIRRWTLFGKN